MAKGTVLIIEDDPDGRRSVAEAVADAGMEAVVAATGEEGVSVFASQPFDAVLTDLVLPDIDGIEVLRRIQGRDPQVPVMIMTAYGTVASAVGALKAGAQDYITKPIDLDELQSRVARAVETRRLREEVRELHRSLESRYGVNAIVGETPPMRQLRERILALADTTATVLVQGESGTGKELVARALHYDGRRRDRPFVAVSCGAFAETLLESELFGHEKGAFTGAAGRRKGAFERADGGTLFLDEIGDAPRPVQVKLLRVIEAREIVRLGGSETIHVDVRLVSATNRDLDDLVASGEFRQDLLYRLRVVTLRVPPLRERIADIRPLAERFVAQSCAEHGRHIRAIAPAFLDALEQHAWPGNVRELRNAVEASVLMTRGDALDAADLQIGAPLKAGRAGELNVPAAMSFADIEREVLMQSLSRNNGNRTLAADELGISRRTIQRKIRDYKLPF